MRNGKKRVLANPSIERLESRQLLSAAVDPVLQSLGFPAGFPPAGPAAIPGLTDGVYHGSGSNEATPNPNQALNNGVLGGDNAALNRTVAYAAAHAPNYTYTNTGDTFVYSGPQSNALTSAFLGADAQGAAATDSVNVNDTIFDAHGFFQTPTANDTGNYNVYVPGNGVTIDDLIAVYIGGNGTPGSGTLVASGGWQGANAGLSESSPINLAGAQYNEFTFPLNVAGLDSTQAASIPIEVVYSNGFGGANSNAVPDVQGTGNYVASAVQIDDPNNVQVTSYQTNATNEPLALAPVLTDTPGNNAVLLNWNTTSFANSFTVQRYVTSAGAGTAVVLQSGLTTTSYTDSTATNGTNYSYFVTADNAAGSTPSNTITATPVAGPTGPVTNLTAIRASATSVQLSFTAPTLGTNFTISRSTTLGGTQTTLVGPVGQTATTYTDNTAVAGTDYFYTVISVDTAGGHPSPAATVFVGHGEGWSADYYTSTIADPAQNGNNKPISGDDPTSVLAFERIDPNISVLSNTPPGWNSIQPNTNNDFAVRWVGFVEAPVTGYYSFSVSNIDDRELITVYDPNNLTNGSPTPVAISPGGTAHVMTGFGDNYTSPVIGADAGASPYLFTAGQKYLVQVDYNQGFGGLNANLSWAASSTTANQTAATFDVMSPQTVPQYDVAPQVPAFSTVDSTGTVGKDQSYYNFTATAGNATVILNWNSVPTDSYNVYRSNNSNGPFTLLNTSPIAATANGAPLSLTDSSVTNNTTYFYILTGVNQSGETAINTATGLTSGLTTSATPLPLPPAAPSGVVAGGTNSTTTGIAVTVEFPSVLFANSYIIQRAIETSPGSLTPGTFATVPGGAAVTGSGSTISFTDADLNLKSNVRYFYQVIAVNGAGNSSPSNIATVNPIGPALTAEGTVEFNVEAAAAPVGSDTTLANLGSAGGIFNSFGGAITVGNVTDANSATYQALQFSGTNSASSTVNSTSDLTGNSTRSIELWVNNPTIDSVEESMVAWSHRGGNPDGSNMSFSYGSQYGVGLWGGEYDLQYTSGNLGVGATNPGAPVANTWHYMVFTYDGTTSSVYLDGALYLSQAIANGGLATFAGFPVDLAAQNNTGIASAFQASNNGSIDLASVRISGGALTPADVMANFTAGVEGQPTAAGVSTTTFTKITTDTPNPSSPSQAVTLTATIQGGVANGSTITFEDASNSNAVLGTAMTTAGVATFINPGGTLSTGTHNIIAVYGGTTGFQASTSASVAQVVAPVAVTPTVVSTQVGDGTAQRSSVKSFSITFNEAVHCTSSSFTLFKATMNADGTVAGYTNDVSAGVSFSSSDNITWTFTGVAGGTLDRNLASGTGFLSDGVYRLVLHGAAVTDFATGTAALGAGDQNASFASNNPGAVSGTAQAFHVLFGDTNDDGIDNNTDLLAFSRAWTPNNKPYNANLDFNGDGVVNNADLLALSRRFLKPQFSYS